MRHRDYGMVENGMYPTRKSTVGIVTLDGGVSSSSLVFINERVSD